MFLHHAAEESNKWLDGWHIEPALIAGIGMLFLVPLAWAVDPGAVIATFAALVATSPLWLPVGLFRSFWKAWMHYIRFIFWFKQPMVLLHITLPPEVTKSPLAMELFLTTLANAGGETTFIQRIWKGQYRAITTLELVSNEGRIGYYIHLRAAWKNFVEARLYGQFPEAQVAEVEDYVDAVHYSPETHELWGTEYQKSGKVAAALPIKTYIDWQLDKDPDKPETTIDPITHILEFLGTVGPDEYVWIQIVMKARKGDEWYGFYKGDHYTADAAKQIQNITKSAVARVQGIIDDPDAKKRAGERGPTLMTEGDRDDVSAIERSLGKPVFDCGFRGMYIVKKSRGFDLTRVNNLVLLWSPFNGGNKLGVTRGKSIFDYPWQDWKDIRRNMISKKLFFWYKHRAYFYVPYDQKPVCMTTEELATLWHFPNSSVKTPALERVPSRRSDAPTNLPV